MTPVIKPVHPSALIWSVDFIGQDPENRSGWFAAAMALRDKFPRETLAPLVIRIEALARIIGDDRRSDAWCTDEAPDGGRNVDHAMFKAAALAPIVDLEDGMAFDADRFFELVIEHAKPEGRA